MQSEYVFQEITAWNPNFTSNFPISPPPSKSTGNVKMVWKQISVNYTILSKFKTFKFKGHNSSLYCFEFNHTSNSWSCWCLVFNKNNLCSKLFLILMQPTWGMINYSHFHHRKCQNTLVGDKSFSLLLIETLNDCHSVQEVTNSIIAIIRKRVHSTV